MRELHRWNRGSGLKRNRVPKAFGTDLKKGRSVKQKAKSPLVQGQLNQDEAGQSQSPGNNGRLSMTRRSFVEDLRKRASQPLRESPEHRQALAECVAANEARKKPSHYTCSTWEWNWRLLLACLALIVLCGLLWTGCRVVEAAGVVMDKHTSDIRVELAE